METEFLKSAIESFALLEESTGISTEMIESAHRRLHKLKKDKTALKRNEEDLDEVWLEKENDVFNTFVCAQGCFQKHCEFCCRQTENSVVVKCHHCKKHLCSDCDLKIHCNSPFHRRIVYFSDATTKNLLPHEFINPTSGSIFFKGNFSNTSNNYYHYFIRFQK